MEEINHRCGLCPHPVDTHIVNAYADNLHEAPWMNLRCAHRFHTHCFLQQRLFRGRDTYDGIYTTCPTCRMRILPEATVTELAQNDPDMAHDRTVRQRLAELWNTHEVFRADIRELRRVQRVRDSSHRAYSSEASAIRREWKELSKPSIDYLKTVKRNCIKKVMALKTRMPAQMAQNKFRIKKREVLNTYNADSWNLQYISDDCPGAPKFPRGGMYGYYARPQYMFRMRL